MVIDVLSVDCPDCGALAEVQTCEELPGDNVIGVEHDMVNNRYGLFPSNIHFGRFAALVEKYKKELENK